MGAKPNCGSFGAGALFCLILGILVPGLTSSGFAGDTGNCSMNDPDHIVSMQTGTEDGTAEKQPDLSGPGVTATITKTIRYNFNQNETDDRGRTKRKTWNSTKAMTVFVQFDEKNMEVVQGFDPSTMQMKPKRYKLKPQSYRVASSSYEASGRGYEAWQNGPILEYEIRDSSTESGTCSDLVQDQEDFPLIIDFDVSSGKIVNVTMPSFTASLNITGERKCTKKEAGSDPKDVKTTDCSYSLDRTEQLGTQAVSGSDECWEITGGDGKTSVSGGCRAENKQRLSTEEAEFTWEINIRE